MTPRWRAVLRVRRLLRLLLENDVPLGRLETQLLRATELADADLVQAEANTPAILHSMTGELSRLFADSLVGEEPFGPGEPGRLQVVVDEVERRRLTAQQRFDATLDQGANAVQGELDELLSFLAGFGGIGPTQPDPLPPGEPLERRRAKALAAKATIRKLARR